jgi:hypothetical protein
VTASAQCHWRSVEITHMFAGERPPSVPRPGVSILLRVFVHFHGRRVALLLAGYDKQDDASKKVIQGAVRDAYGSLP